MVGIIPAMAWPLIGRDHEQQQLREALDDASGRPVALVGPAGAGVSRLLGCVVDHGRARGWHVCALSASPAMQTIPFAAVAPFAAGGGELDTVDGFGVMAALERDLLEAAGGADLVMVVDEADRLDAGSVALLERLRDHRRARIVVAVGERPRVRAGGWRLSTTDTEIIEVAPLSRAAHDRLVDAVCERPATHEAKQAIWDHTGGRPRDLELLLDAIDRSGVLDASADVWNWNGEPVDSPGLRALIAESLAGASDAARGAFEFVAVGAPLPDAVADVVLGDTEREELERAGLVQQRPDEGAGLRPARPLVAAGVAAALGAATRRRLVTTLAAVEPSSGSPWALRHAQWALEAGAPIAVDDRSSLAREALAASDLELAEAIARQAIAERTDDVASRLLVVECLRRRRRSEEALRELELAEEHVEDDTGRADIAILRSQIWSLLRNDAGAALGHLDAAMPTVGDPVATRRLARERELATAFAESVRTVEAPFGDEVVGSDAVREELMVVALLGCLHLDLAGIDDVLGRLRAAVNDAADPLSRARLAVCEHLALVGRGAVGVAHRAARTALDEAASRGEPLGMWALCVAFSGPLAGDLDGAAVAAFDADRSFRSVDPFGLRPFAAAVGATAALQAGRADMAATLASVAEAPARGTDPRVADIAAGRRRAWEAVIAGDDRRAAEEAAAAGRSAMDAGHRLWGVIGLHEAVRLGAPELVVDDLRAAATSIDSALLRSFAAHADALANESTAALDSVAAELAALGCPLLAAEAAAQAATFAGRETTRHRAAARAEVWWRRCSGRVPPALAHSPRGLTERQHEIAGLAALGLTSQEIADRLVVARRTVDNHLRSVYRRLGVGGREELAAELAVAIG